jgi:GNAT superfamily N-acetyltransferase
MSRSGVDVRTRTAADLPALVLGLRLVAEADGYPSRWPEDPAEYVRGGDGLLGAWVADRSGEVLGQALLRRPGGQAPVRMWCAATGSRPATVAVLSRLFVVPAGRGWGVGEALVAAAVREAARLGRRPVLDVVTTNRAAVRLYERLGWTRFGWYEDRFHPDGPVERLLCFAAPAR